jgi:hypothetical protein
VIAIGKAKKASAELLFPQVPVKRLQILQNALAFSSPARSQARHE